MFGNIYSGRKVLVTGHTGFKGSWLSMWLLEIGADVCGYALAPSTTPDNFTSLDLQMESVIADIRDRERLNAVIDKYQPDLVFHLAAQPIVLESYSNPVETFEVNAQGTVNLLEVCRHTESVTGVVVITTDKCYENNEQGLAFKESDPMGGNDPYSASKACAEIICKSYSRSFYELDGKGLCSCRSGNVIGGGDWAADRLVPDLMRAAASGKSAIIRNPGSVRPWLHVLEPLSGYLMLGAELLAVNNAVSGAWNFGPGSEVEKSVAELAELAKDCWSGLCIEDGRDVKAPHEAKMLKLDSAKALSAGWQPVWDFEQSVSHTVNWYRDFYLEGINRCRKDLYNYCKDAESKGVKWTE